MCINRNPLQFSTRIVVCSGYRASTVVHQLHVGLGLVTSVRVEAKWFAVVFNSRLSYSNCICISQWSNKVCKNCIPQYGVLACICTHFLLNVCFCRLQKIPTLHKTKFSIERKPLTTCSIVYGRLYVEYVQYILRGLVEKHLVLMRVKYDLRDNNLNKFKGRCYLLLGYKVV